MTWLKTIIPAAPETIAETQDRLSGAGFDSFQVEDERDVLERSPGWEMTDEGLLEYYKGLCRVIVYLQDSPEGRDSLALLRSLFDGVSAEPVREEDWEEGWKQYYKPFEVGKRLLVQPEWEPVENPSGRVVFLNNPGMTFGTGLHASTRLCLELTDKYIEEGRRVLDIGSGSGILSVCALLLGAASAVCVDIDPLAADVSAENAERNGVEVTPLCGDILGDAALRARVGAGYDIVFSNIVADVIIPLSAFAGDFLAQEGVWIVSGIIAERLPEVLEALEGNGFAVRESLESEGWAALVCEMRGD